MATEFDAHECAYCEGSKIATCDCCGEETDCGECHGTGIDSGQFDTEKYAADMKAFGDRMYQLASQSPNGGVMIMAGVMEDGKTIGVEGFNGDRLLLENYRLSDE